MIDPVWFNAHPRRHHRVRPVSLAEELAESILQRGGLLQPIRLRPRSLNGGGGGRFCNILIPLKWVLR